MSRMPKLPFDKMTADFEEHEARIVCAARNSRTGCLRASKPFGRIDFEGDDLEMLFKASANYVWRMLCFDFVDFRPHSCMPICADFDLGAVFYSYQERGNYANRDERKVAERAVRDGLDALVKRAESVIPVTEQKGIMRWAKAYGLV